MTLLSKIGLVLLNVIVFLFEESWIIAMVAFFPFWLAIILVTLLLSFFSMVSTCFCHLANLPPIIEKWMERKREKAGERLLKVVKGGIWTSCLMTAIVISPTTSAVMFEMAGIRGTKAYAADVLFSFVSGTIWCVIYGGGILILRKIF